MPSFLTRRRRGALVGAICLMSGAGTALAVAGGPSRVTIRVTGGPSFKVNAYAQDGVHYAITGSVAIRSGGAVTINNTTAEGHSLTLVRKADLPRTNNQINNCAICTKIATAHGIDLNGPPTNGPPPHPVLEVGAAGFDTPGDSVVFGPKGHGSTVSFKVTAARGTTLYFMCVFHPWMQGRFVVK